MAVTNSQACSLDTALEILSLAAFLAPFVLIQAYWDQLPNQVPIHFDASGNADGFETKESLYIAPVIGFGSFLLLTVLSLPIVPIEAFNLPKSVDRANPVAIQLARRMLRWIKLVTCLLFSVIVWMQIQGALRGSTFEANLATYGLIACIFIIAGYYLLRMKKLAPKGPAELAS